MESIFTLASFRRSDEEYEHKTEPEKERIRRFPKEFMVRFGIILHCCWDALDTTWAKMGAGYTVAAPTPVKQTCNRRIDDCRENVFDAYLTDGLYFGEKSTLLNSDGVEGMVLLNRDQHYYVGDCHWKGIKFEGRYILLILDDAKLRSGKYAFPVTTVTRPDFREKPTQNTYHYYHFLRVTQTPKARHQQKNNEVYVQTIKRWQPMSLNPAATRPLHCNPHIRAILQYWQT